MQNKLYSILTIAESDSSAGAGIQADIKAASALGVHAATAITAITSQSTSTVSDIFVLPADVVVSQIEAAISDQLPGAIKIGMIGSIDNGKAIVKLLKGKLKGIPVVVDPVLDANSVGDNQSELIDFYKKELLPLATVYTPSIPEAGKLLGCELTVADFDQQKAAAYRLMDEIHANAVILKGGHVDNPDFSTDILVYRDGDKLSQLSCSIERQTDANLRGSGDAYSTLLASCLAIKPSLSGAFIMAGRMMDSIIKRSIGYIYGTPGNGPLNVSNLKINQL